jgi:hypothetical protein
MSSTIKRFLSCIVLFSLLFSCAPARYVKPLDKGQHALQVNLGGPIAKVPGIGVIPMPLTTVGYGYGMKENLTLFGNLHTTSLLFGVGQVDVGAAYRCWSGKNMGITLQPTLNVAVDFYTGANRFWPQLDANYYWDYNELKTKAKNGKGFYKIRSVYGGISNWFDPYLIESQVRKNEQFSNRYGMEFLINSGVAIGNLLSHHLVACMIERGGESQKILPARNFDCTEGQRVIIRHLAIAECYSVID